MKAILLNHKKVTKVDLIDVWNIDIACFKGLTLTDKDLHETYTNVCDHKCLFIALYDGYKIVGYLWAYSEAYNSKKLRKYMSDLKCSKNNIYVDAIAILPKYRALGGVKLLFDELFDNTKQNTTYSGLFRVANGMADNIKKNNEVILVYDLPKWKGYLVDEDAQFIRFKRRR